MGYQLVIEAATYTTNTGDELSCSQQISNLRSQKLSGCRPMPSTVQTLGLAC